MFQVQLGWGSSLQLLASACVLTVDLQQERLRCSSRQSRDAVRLRFRDQSQPARRVAAQQSPARVRCSGQGFGDGV